ncbi:MAG TPA: hypothetical protein VHY91_20675 [Pirellulales bacterium]|nr:hypothetical protein [Pirellulales bacterium]
MIGCRGITRLVALSASAAVIAGTPLSASEPGNTPAIAAPVEAARVLELGDHYTYSSVGKARACYEQMRAKPDVDARIQYALVLVLIRQHCQKEAVALLGGMIARDPAALHVWRAKIWVELAAHDECGALADARSAADVLARHNLATLNGDGAQDRRTTAEFLGRAFGFLALRHTGALPADEVHTARQYVLARLGDEQLLFKQQEQLLVQEFFSAEAAFDNLRATRIADATSKRQRYAKQKQEVDEAEADLDYFTETVKLAIQADLDKANYAVVNACMQLLFCQLRLNVVREQIQFNLRNVTLYPTEDLIDQEDKERRQRTSRINDIIRAFPRIVAHRDEVFGQAGSKLEQLSERAKGLKRKERRLERLEQAEAKKIAAWQRNTLTVKPIAFATFEPFPFDAEKQRVREMADP